MDDSVVFIVDDDAGVRESLRWMIESAGLRVKTYARAEDFLATYRPTRAGCLVLDLRMPGMNGIALQQQLIERRIHIGVIFITAHASVPTAVNAMRAGAVDFLTKPFSEQALLDRIHHCIEKARRESSNNAERADFAARFARLTPREQEILRDVVSGKSNKIIAAERKISQKTVESHRAKMMHKLQAHSLADLMRKVFTEQI